VADLGNCLLLFDTTLDYEEGDLILREVHGVEALSTLYEFELTVECTIEGGLDAEAVDELLLADVSIGFGENGLRRVAGCLSQILLLEMSADSKFSLYRMELVPRLWRTTLTYRSRCFVEMSIPDIIRKVLTEHGFADGTDFELKITDGDYFANEDHHVVQYEETDFNFLSRWMERLGLFYLFEQTDSGELLVIADKNSSLSTGPDDGALEYSYRDAIHETGHIGGLRRLTRARPAKLHVRDYNWRLPEDQRQEIADSRTVGATTRWCHGDAPVDETGGVGFVSYSGGHLPDPEVTVIPCEPLATLGKL